MGFAQGVSGLNASAANLDVIGNNIANSGTIGYKSGSVQFADVYAGSQIGLGAKVASLTQNFAAGAVQTSTRVMDVAITNGDGFFRLTSPGGEVAYSRNGQFNVDKNGFMVNAAGLQLTGFQVGANGAIAGGSPTALQLPTSAMTPKQTTNINAQFNLDARAVNSPIIPVATTFDANDSTTYNYSNAATIYDSLGNSHELVTYFRKNAVNTWDTYATADGYPLTAAGAMVAAPTPAGPPTIANSAKLADGTLGFDLNGILNGGAPSTLVGGKMSITGLDFGNGSAPMTFTTDVTGTTQFGNDNDVKKLTQDGFTSGVITSYAINQDGTVIGKYSNEQTKTLGQIVLSSFINPNGLQSKGDNVWSETSASGQPLTGTPGAGTKRGALVSGALESSNVDLTAELVNLIIAQRTYQANSQTVKTQDQVMQTLMNMR
ncbi:flagellar hook protein FlgE [Herminiimonas sp. CN]|uniref:flagellar hook protein FlgE n=1 Tax=Herminiimonas sp. CN TaxID=1349818 RepID=UPI000473E463|nr:flagellar hook protein FlgE [Herminiimonas sp. CN]